MKKPLAELSRSLDRDGYVRISGSAAEALPIASADWVIEHWLVMYEADPDFALWARANKWTIHHKNGVRDDNRMENLEWRAPGRHPNGWTLEEMAGALRRAGYRVERK